jgi:hypothetical protein
MEIYELCMNNSDILGLAGEMRDSVIFFNNRGKFFI